MAIGAISLNETGTFHQAIVTRSWFSASLRAMKESQLLLVGRTKSRAYQIWFLGMRETSDFLSI